LPTTPALRLDDDTLDSINHEVRLLR
jgi:hypothetical protein